MAKPNLKPFVVNGWEVAKLPLGNAAMYSVTVRTIKLQKLTFYFRNKHTAVSFCQMNPATGLILLENNGC